MTKPLIGITPDRNDAADNIESHFFVRRNYCRAVADSGGIPLILPYEGELVDHYLHLVDGIIVTGGMFDVDPIRYGMEARFPDKMHFKEDRTCFEQAVLRGALKNQLPVLGICGGMQLIAIELGSALVQHIPSEVNSAIEHKQSMSCGSAAHRIHLAEDSHLRRLVGVGEGEVNSLHHQSVLNGNPRVRVSAVADDGVIEAIEAVDEPFCIGVQWHPEYLVNAWEHRLFTGLIDAAIAASKRPRLRQ